MAERIRSEQRGASERGRGGLPGISAREATLDGDEATRPWSGRLRLFLRAVAIYELLKGLVHWAVLLAGGASGPDASVASLVAAGFFAAADPVAAVGLWIGAGWGVVVWLLAAIGQLVAAAVVPDASEVAIVGAGAALALIMAFLVLSLRARRETA